MRPVMAQLSPPEPWNTSLTGVGGHVDRHLTWLAWASGLNQFKSMKSSSQVNRSHLSRLSFVAKLPPLGVARFFLVAASSHQPGIAVVSNVTVVSNSSCGVEDSRDHADRDDASLTLRNAELLLTVDRCTGLIDNATSVRRFVHDSNHWLCKVFSCLPSF